MTTRRLANATTCGIRKSDQQWHVMTGRPMPVGLESLRIGFGSSWGRWRNASRLQFVADVSLMVSEDDKKRSVQQSHLIEPSDEAPKCVVEIVDSLKIVAHRCCAKLSGIEAL